MKILGSPGTNSTISSSVYS
ncbi:unnamed protein product [Linum tenue]|nr:unnamed protein product [Linum tenue]